jgi:Mg-chelatase subunit ChlD
MDDIENTVSQLHPGGTTEIGTYLRKRILEPLVYNNPQMTRPLFVSIITDGVPSGPKGSPENRNTLRDEIIRCQTWLEENRLPPRGTSPSLPIEFHNELTCL